MEKSLSNVVFYNEHIPEVFTTPAAIIRIWSSCTKRKCPDLKIWRHKSEGHVSLELIKKNESGKFCRGSFGAGTYISAEPDPRTTGDCIDAFEGYPVHYIPSYKDDLSQHYIDKGIKYEGEGQEPNRTIVLYTLDVDEMANQFLEFLKSHNKHQWKMLVAVLSLSECGKGEFIYVNCVTLVLAILNIGGFSKIQGVIDQMSGLGIASTGAVRRRTEKDSIGKVTSASLNALWTGVKCISSPIYISPDVFDYRIVSAKKRELETLAGKNKPLLSFKNDISVVDWDEIQRLKQCDAVKYKQLKKLDPLFLLNSLPRKDGAKVEEWLPC